MWDPFALGAPSECAAHLTDVTRLAALFRGEISSINKQNNLVVVYSDGDHEALTLAEIAKCLPEPLASHAADFGKCLANSAKAGGGGSSGKGGEGQGSLPTKVRKEKPAKELKARGNGVAHVNVHHGSKWKGGSEQRVNRVGTFETAMLQIEAKGGITVYRSSETSMRERKMALNVDKIVIAKGNNLFCEKMNDTLRLPQDKTDDNTKLCSGVRETMRYLGLLPAMRSDDGRLDWSCGVFAFNDEAREERLARAIQTHKRGSRGAGAAAENRDGSRTRAGGGESKAAAKQMVRTFPKTVVKHVEKVREKKALGKQNLRQVKPEVESVEEFTKQGYKRRRRTAGFVAGQIDSEARSPPSFCPFELGGILWVKRGLTRGGVKFGENLSADLEAKTVVDRGGEGRKEEESGTIKTESGNCALSDSPMPSNLQASLSPALDNMANNASQEASLPDDVVPLCRPGFDREDVLRRRMPSTAFQEAPLSGDATPAYELEEGRDAGDAGRDSTSPTGEGRESVITPPAMHALESFTPTPETTIITPRHFTPSTTDKRNAPDTEAVAVKRRKVVSESEVGDSTAAAAPLASKGNVVCL